MNRVQAPVKRTSSGAEPITPRRASPFRTELPRRVQLSQLGLRMVTPRVLVDAQTSHLTIGFDHRTGLNYILLNTASANMNQN